MVESPMVEINDMWGKFVAGEPPTFKPLIGHMVDVASVAQAMWSHSLSPVIRSEISQYLKLSDKDAMLWMSFWAGLHDLGKATPAFQAKRPEAKSFLQTKGYKFTKSEKPHGLMSAYIIAKAFSQGQPFALPSDLRTMICFSLGGHHGIFPDDLLFSRVNVLDAGMGNWERVQIALTARLADLIGVNLEKKPSPDGGINGTFFTLLSGLTSVGDWIASSEAFFSVDTKDDDLEQYKLLSQELARQAIEHLRWESRRNEPSERSFNEVFPFITQPYPLQNEAIEFAKRLDGPGLIIVEAPMGEGKTEVALYLAERWNAMLKHDGFYIALPTQATADQMFTRTVDYLRGCGKKVNLALLHGHAVLSDEYQQIWVRGDVPDEPGYELIAGEWFTYRKRGILSPYGVGTIDQVLLSVLPTKHFFVRLFGLAGKVVIIDEVHSYDVYMSTLLDRLLVWLKALGSSIIILSATLPSGRRNVMLSSYIGHDLTIQAASYPRLTWSINGIEGSSTFESASSSRSGRPREILLSWVKDDPEDILCTIEAAIVDGGAVAVICNTVAKAQSTFLFLNEHLSPAGVDVDLFHARYPYGQRKVRQDRVLSRFGKGERDPKVKQVLVATQVIEQSLDLDFDLMITEIAPVDLVLQRMGRLHRHDRAKRPDALVHPTLYTIEPQTLSSGTPDYGKTGFVYSEHILLRSQLVLGKVDRIRLPSDIESMVEEVYGGSELPVPSDAWSDALIRSKKELEEAMLEKESKGVSRMIPLPTYDRPWDATRYLLKEDDPDIHHNLQAQTRDSPPNVLLICLFGDEGAPSLDPEGNDIIDLSREPSSSMMVKLLDRAVAISDPGVVRFFKDRPTPIGWRRSSVLSKYKVAFFSKILHSLDHYCLCGGRYLVMSEKLGISTVDGEPSEI